MKDENYTENYELDAADMFHILLKLGWQSAQAKLTHTRRTCASHSVAHVGRSFAHTRALTSLFTYKTRKASNARKAYAKST